MSSGIVLNRTVSRRRPALALLAILLAGASVLLGGRDQGARGEARSMLQSVGLPPPGAIETIAVMDSGDSARAFAVEVILADLAPGGDAKMVSVQRGRDTREPLKAAVAQAALALRERPGSAHHRMLLAKAAYAMWDLDPEPKIASTNTWKSAFRGASDGAPGFDLVATARADACLSAWPRLSRPEQDEALSALRRALESRDYLRGAFPDAWRVIGAPALGLLPDDPEALAQTATWLRAIGESKGADELDRRRTHLGGH